jgi:FO synthase subunit 2
MHVKQMLPELRSGPTGNEVIRLYAIARLMLGATFRNLQVSWVKEGLRQAQFLLSCGANDLGGTLINESISTSAGAGHGQFQPPGELRRAIRDAGRTPFQRDTLYRTVRDHPREASPEGEGEIDALDRIADADATFGTYVQLTRDGRHRFQKPPRPRAQPTPEPSDS